MNDDILKALSGQMVETPSGLLVTGGTIENLIKSEAKAEAVRIAKDEERRKSSLFSSYLVHNMALYGAREKPQNTPSFRTLYTAAKHSFIDAILIRARIDQMKRVWRRSFSDEKLGFRVVHERHEDPDFKGSKDIDKRCREMEALIANPTPEEHIHFYPHKVRPHNRIKDLISVLAKAELIIDRKVIRRLRRADGQGYAAFHWIPGETIKNVDEAIKEWASRNETKGQVTKWTAERMSEATQFDITRAAYVQVVDGVAVDAYAADEISVHISNPSDEINRFGYGESRLELSLDVTATLMHAWNFNKEMFKTNYPESILTISGDYDKEGLQAFKQSLMGETHGSGNYWRLPVIPSGNQDSFKVEAHKLRETPKDMLFDQFVRLLIMIKASAYGAHPSLLNMQVDSGGGQSLFGHNQVDEIEISKEHGLIPALEDMCDWLTDAIIKPRYDDLMLVITGLDHEAEKDVVDIRSARTAKWMTKNEARLEEGKPPMGFWVEPEQYKNLSDEDRDKYDKNPWNYPSDVPIANYINTFQMMGQQDEGEDQDGEDQDEGQYQPDPEGDDSDEAYDQMGADDQPDYYQQMGGMEKSQRQEKFIEIRIGDD